MATRWISFGGAGAADGSSRGNAAPWTGLNQQISLAAAGAAPFVVNVIAEDTYTMAAGGYVATLSTGGASFADRVTVRPINAADEVGPGVWWNIRSDRSQPYVSPPPTDDDLWSPVTVGAESGRNIFALGAGTDNLLFEGIDARRTGPVFTPIGAVGNVSLHRIRARNIRRFWQMAQGGPAWAGTDANHATVTNVDIRGYSKNCFQMSRTTYVDFADCFLDSEAQAYDGISSGWSTVGNSANDASHDLSWIRCHTRNNINPRYIVTPYRASIAPSGGTPTGGTFKLIYGSQTTGAIAWNASNQTVKTALAALSNLTTDQLFLAGGNGQALPAVAPLIVGFGWDLVETGPASALTIDASLLTGGSYAVATQTAWAPLAVGYWQGDGWSTEEYDYAMTWYAGCEANNCADGGWDLKSFDSIIHSPVASGCKRTIRNHPALDGVVGPVQSRVLVIKPRTFDAVNRAYGAGLPLEGQRGTGGQSHFQSNGLMYVMDPVVEDADDYTVVFNPESSTGEMTVFGGVVTRSAGSTFSAATSGARFKHVGTLTETLV